MVGLKQMVHMLISNIFGDSSDVIGALLDASVRGGLILKWYCMECSIYWWGRR